MTIHPTDRRVTEALRALQVQLDAGVNLPKALRAAGSVCGGRAERVFTHAAELAGDGYGIEDLADVLAPALSYAERTVLVAGWQSGRVNQVLEAIIERRELVAGIGRKVRSALILPALVLLAAAFVAPLPGLILSGDIVTYLQAALPPVFLGVMIVMTIRAMLLARAGALRNRPIHAPPAPPAPLDYVLMYTPVAWRTHRLLNLAEFTSLLGNLLTAGIQVLDALQQTARAMPNGLYRRELVRVAEEVKQGNPVSETLDPGRFWPYEFITILEIGETSGTPDEALRRMARDYRERYANAMQWWGAVLARLAYALVALFVIYHIVKGAMVYVNLIQGALP